MEGRSDGAVEAVEAADECSGLWPAKAEGTRGEEAMKVVAAAAAAEEFSEVPERERRWEG